VANLQQVHRGSDRKPAIVMVHGLGGHPVDTWRHHTCDKGDCWPHWIGQDTGCDTWVLDYDAGLSAWRDQAMPLPDQGDQVLDLLDSQPELRGRALVLVGHSMGGLVIKTLIVRGRSRGYERFQAVVDRVRGVVFIATPHAGSHLANLARAARWVLRTNVQLGNMAAHDPHLRQLHQEFRHALSELDCDVHVLAERQGVRIGPRVFGWQIGPRIMVVNASSGDPGLSGIATVPMAGNHFSICKPKDRKEHIHLSVCQFVERLQDGSERVAPPTVRVEPVVAPTALYTPPSPNQLGRLTGSQDNRLLPRESRVYGRETEVAKVLAFLRASGSPVTAAVVGVGGTGKTEVCKAALKIWLAENPGAVAYYVSLGDRANAAELISGIASALGASAIDSLAQLLAIVTPGTYYLDNLESVVDQREGQDLLRALANRPGVRLLTSSRVSVPTILGSPIVIDALPDQAALSLFRDLWAGQDTLPDDATLKRFVIGGLGGHALSVTLTARLGDVYSYASLLERWSNAGTDLPHDFEDASRLGSLSVSLRLTADALANRAGALALWTSAALFPAGVPDSLLARLEAEGGWSEARPALVRHHLLSRRNDRWHMLPPVARFALDASARAQAGFDWTTCRDGIRAVFEPALTACNSVASTDESLAARRWLLDNFEALTRLMLHEFSCNRPDPQWTQLAHDRLLNVYPFTVVRSREFLPLLIDRLERPGSAVKTLGDLEFYLDDSDGARALYDRALALCEQSQDRVGEASTLQALGDLERRLLHYDEARLLYERALKLNEQFQNVPGLANTLIGLGVLERRLDHPEEARALFERALGLFEREKSGIGQANALQLLGDLLRERRDFPNALATYERALTLYTQEQEPMGMTYTLAELARCHHALDDVQKRDETMGKAFAIALGAAVDRVTLYAADVLVEITGSREAAGEWLDRHGKG
jgi:tetratricopeptide (TPR) repeat protein/pimeloyl-ACP methyl ester carboxylesterase